MWDIFVFTQYSYYRDFFFLEPAPRLRERHCHRWVRYIDTTKIVILRFVWDRSVFTQYSYYHELFYLGTALRLFNHHCHGWVFYIDTKKITVWCMSSMLLPIYLRWFYYFILFYFKLTNGAMVKWRMVKWCNGEINIRIGRFVYHKYWICSFILFPNTTFSQQTKKSTTFNFYH